MPSPIGHALAGAVVAWAATDRRPADETRLTLTCAALAAAPDLDLLAPRAHRAYTHSVGAVLLIMIVAAMVTRWVTPRRALRLTLICVAAYASHLLLDWLAVDTFPPVGIRALWPFSDGWFISGWGIFPETARRHLLTRPVLLQNAHAVTSELLVLGPIAAAVLMVRFFLARRRAPAAG